MSYMLAQSLPIYYVEASFWTPDHCYTQAEVHGNATFQRWRLQGDTCFADFLFLPTGAFQILYSEKRSVPYLGSAHLPSLQPKRIGMDTYLGRSVEVWEVRASKKEKLQVWWDPSLPFVWEQGAPAGVGLIGALGRERGRGFPLRMEWVGKRGRRKTAWQVEVLHDRGDPLAQVLPFSAN
jgi:hypothetical protein